MTLDEAIKRYTSNAFYEKSDGNLQGYLEFNQLAEWLKDYKRLLEQDPYEDAISRQAVIALAKEECDTAIIPYRRFVKDINDLPPVTPQPKTGHWIEKYAEDGCGERYSYWACSECGRDVGFNLANIEDVLSDYPYCHCGAKMVETKESEVKE